MNSYAQRVLENIKQTAGWEKEFIQSVTEVFESLGKLLDRDSKYEKNKILERIVVPERPQRVVTPQPAELPDSL